MEPLTADYIFCAARPSSFRIAVAFFFILFIVVVVFFILVFILVIIVVLRDVTKHGIGHPEIEGN